jgi:hypothetical protein
VKRLDERNKRRTVGDVLRAADAFFLEQLHQFDVVRLRIRTKGRFLPRKAVARHLRPSAHSEIAVSLRHRSDYPVFRNTLQAQSVN